MKDVKKNTNYNYRRWSKSNLFIVLYFILFYFILFYFENNNINNKL